MCQRRVVRSFLAVFRLVRRPFLYVGRIFDEKEETEEIFEPRKAASMGLICRGRRPSTAQMFGWALLLIELLLETISTLPLFTPYLTIVFIVGLSLILIQVFFLTIFDPIPEALEEKRKLGIKPLPFDPLRHRHVIENQYCNVCEIPVKNFTKHCRRCNMCVEEFDHHCVWLNNCVGRHNYKRFLILVTSLAFFSISGCLVAFVLVISFFSHASLIEMGPNNETLRLERWFFTDLDQRLWLTSTVVCLFVNIVCAILTIHLLVFHFKIIRQGISTYIFISLRRKPTREAGTATGSEEPQPEQPAAQPHLGTNTTPVKVIKPTSGSPLRVRAVADSSPQGALSWAQQDMYSFLKDICQILGHKSLTKLNPAFLD
ncbi:unnamed protein product, partial [Mesorhabditis belari]|uniref:Palmitoyltransferase n=1 Tax=Mesorhabditis belari TaxID=2138241 RepID=A0AAF3F2B3_9BILA